MNKDSVKDETLDKIRGSSINEPIGDEFIVDLAIQKTAEAIFADIAMLNGEDGLLWQEDYEKLKNKWCCRK